MKAVWEYEKPITYSQIRTVLTQQKGWESPTVNTLVNRLVKKGILIQVKKEGQTMNELLLLWLSHSISGSLVFLVLILLKSLDYRLAKPGFQPKAILLFPVRLG